METSPLRLSYFQPALFDPGEVSSGALELFPRLWGALEALVDPEVNNRKSGLACLAELDAARFSPLAAYILVTRLQDQDLVVRGEITRIIAGVLSRDVKEQLPPEPVRYVLAYHFSNMQKHQIFKLLEVVENDPDYENGIVILLKACRESGSFLTEILIERRERLAIRKEASRLIGKIGYIDAIPTIDRLISRLESKVNGQQTLPFGSIESTEEAGLLPTLKSAINLLKAP